jgi:hypothetical protein
VIRAEQDLPGTEERSRGGQGWEEEGRVEEGGRVEK